MDSTSSAVGFTVGAALMALLGGAIGTRWPPTPRIRSHVQHLAAGLVFASVAVELLPDVVHRDRPWFAAAGFGVGIVLMLILRSVTQRLAGPGGEVSEDNISWSMIATIYSDVLIDGVILGILLLGTEQGGALVAVGLSAELFSLGLATSGDLAKSEWRGPRSVGVSGGVGVSLLLGGAVGWLLLGGLAGAWLEAILALGAAVLLYLVVEELLVEAHKVPQTPFGTSLFFAGFLLLLLLDMTL